MRELTNIERFFLEDLSTHSPQKQGEYFFFNSYIGYKIKRFKRGRTLLQLHMNMKFEVWEVVHHKDGDKENDDIENLCVLSREEHTSNHMAGSKWRKNWN